MDSLRELKSTGDGQAADEETVRIGALATFLDVAREQKYRASSLDENQRRARYFLLIALIPMVGFIAQDHALVAEHGLFLATLGVRAFVLVMTLACIWRLRQPIDSAHFDRLLEMWLFLLVGMFIWVDTTRPVTYMGYVGLNVVGILFAYLPFIPSLRLQVFPAGVLTLWQLIQLAWKQPADPISRRAAVGAFLLVNLVGFSMSWFIQRSQRERFAAVLKVRTLSGLLPICASCKKIRDGEGKWDHIETYIRERSEADFTHSLCPDCSRRLYPDLFPPGP